MNKIRILTIIAVGMMLINMALLAFFFYSKPGPPREEGPRKLVIEKLRFDATQTKQYDQLIEQHRRDIQSGQDHLRDLKNELFQTLRSDKDSGKKDELISMIGEAQVAIEQIHYAHFEQLKAICKPDQIKAYDEMCDDIAKWFAPQPPRKRR